MLMKHLKKI